MLRLFKRKLFSQICCPDNQTWTDTDIKETEELLKDTEFDTGCDTEISLKKEQTLQEVCDDLAPGTLCKKYANCDVHGKLCA